MSDIKPMKYECGSYACKGADRCLNVEGCYPENGRRTLTPTERKRGKWYVLPAMGGAGEIVEAGAGADGGPGHVGTFELIADAEWIAAMHNARRTA